MKITYNNKKVMTEPTICKPQSCIQCVEKWYIEVNRLHTPS